MLAENKSDSKMMNLLDNGIIISIFIFALGSLPSKALSSIGIGLACLLWLVRIAITKDYEFQQAEINRAVLLFLASLLISGLDVMGVKFLDGVEKILLVILFYYVIINTVTELETVKKLSYTALVSMLITSGYGLYQYFYLGSSKVNGSMLSLAFGCFLSMFLMFLISYLLWRKLNWKFNLSLMVLTIIMGFNLIFTKSRGAWLAFIGGIFSLAWLKDKRLVIGMIIGLVIISIFLPQDIRNRFKSSFVTDIEVSDWNNLDRNMRSNLTRVALWNSTIEMWQEHFINGVGMGQFEEANKNGNYASEYDGIGFKKYSHAHNNFLHFLATTGTIGFIAFSWLMFKMLKVLYDWYYRIYDKSWKLFILASLGAVIIFNVQGLTEFNFGDTELVRFFWFLIALNMVVINKFSRSKEYLSNKNKVVNNK